MTLLFQITVFSPDGHLFQVEYAQEAVRKGTAAVGVRGSDCVVLAVERKVAAKLQDARALKKIVQLDNHIALAFAGLTADARQLVNRCVRCPDIGERARSANVQFSHRTLTPTARPFLLHTPKTHRARVECQSFRLTLGEPASVEHIARHIAGIQQKYTQSGGVRPYGLAALIVGFDATGAKPNPPRLYQTEPSGAFSEWKAQATGRNAKTIREFLEKNYEELPRDGCVKLAARALLEVVEASSRTIEIAVATPEGLTLLSQEELQSVVDTVEAEKEAGGGGQAAQS